MTAPPAGGCAGLEPPLSLGSALAAAIRLLAPISATPRLDAEVLLAHASGTTRAEMIAHPERPLEPIACAALARLVARRQRGEPVAYLTGRREFWSLDLQVTSDTLIPRPDTELLVERALARIPAESAWTALDLGTGSGAIALTLAHERLHLRVVATDDSRAALEVARGNAERLGIGNIRFCRGDWFAPLAHRRFDIIVSNPPYVRSDYPGLRESELRFEPRAALDGGPDGLDAIRKLVAEAPAHFAPGGWLLLEHGFDQGEAVRALLAAHGYVRVRTYGDLAGHERVTEARRPQQKGSE